MMEPQFDPATQAKPTLWDRAKVNAREGFDGTFAGEVVNYNQSGQNARGAADDVFRAIVEARNAGSPVGLEAYQLTDDERRTRPTSSWASPYAGIPVAQLEAEFNSLNQAAQNKRTSYDARVAQNKLESDAVPPWQNEPGVFGKAIAGLTALGGQLAGGALSPENAIGGFGSNVARRPAESVISYATRRVTPGAAEGALGGGIADPVVQSGKIERGEQDGYEPGQTASSVALGAAVGSAFRMSGMLWDAFRASRRRSGQPDAVPESTTPDDILNQLQVDPEFAALARANGVDPFANDPRNAVLQERLTRRRIEEQFRPEPETAPPTAADFGTADRPGPAQQEIARRQEERQAVESGTVDPASTNVVARQPDTRTIAVDNRGGAFRQDEGAGQGRAKGETMAEANVIRLPAPGREHLTDAEIARQRAANEGGQQRTVETPDKLFGQEDRAPQTRNANLEQRQADEAFTLAERQRQRAGDTVRDTQVAGRPQGADQQAIHLDDGHPVEILDRRMMPDAKGNMVEVARVRRYDPRTGQAAADAVEYDVPVRQLKRGNYAAEPRMAQDFESRADVGRTPRGDRMDEAQGLPHQTYRTAPPDDHPREPGRWSRPEQPEGPHPGRRWSTYEEAMRDFEARQARGQEAPKSGNTYEGQKATNQARAKDRDGRFVVDEDGHVMSSAQGPIRFADQKQAARWIVNVGHKESPDQVFEIANHPSGKGFTARERGRSEPPRSERPADSTTRQGHSTDDAENSTINEVRRHLTDGEARQFSDLFDEASSASNHPSEAAPAAGRRQGAPNDAARGSASDERQPGGAESRAEAGGNGTEARAYGRAPAGRSDAVAAPDRGQRADAATGWERASDGQSPLNDAAETSRSATFNSNPFFDPEGWKGVARALGIHSEYFRDLRASFAAMKASWEADSGKRTADLGKKTNALADVGRTIFYSTDGELRAVGQVYKSPTIKRIADMLFAPADMGKGGAVTRTYHEAVEQRTVSNLNKLADVLKPFVGDSGKLNQIRQLVQNSKGIRRGTPIHDAAAKLRGLLDDEFRYLKDAGVDVGQVPDYFPRIVDAERVLRNPVDFTEAAAKQYLKDGIAKNRKDADAMASAWLQSIELGHAGAKKDGTDFVMLGGTPNSDFRKERVFGRSIETDKSNPLARYYLQDPVDVLTLHFQRTARRAEWSRRFGDDLGEWKKLKQAIVDEGNVAALRQVVDAIGVSTGTQRAYQSDAARTAIGFLRTWGAIKLLPRAAITSLSETAMPAIRSGDLTRTLGDVVRTVHALAGGQKDSRELAADLGLISHAIGDSVLGRRYFALEPGSKVQQDIVNRFFRRTGLEQLTQAQRVVAVAAGQTFLRRLAKDVAGDGGRKASSTALLRELGIDDAKGFSTWLAGLNDGMPGLGDVKAEAGFSGQYRTALQRFNLQTSLNPNSSTRPKWANHPIGSLVFMLQSYAYAFQKQVLNRAAAGVKEGLTGKGYGAADRVTMLAPAMALPILAAIQWGISPARDAVFGDPSSRQDHDESDPLLKQYLGNDAPSKRFMQVLSRSGLTGVMEPYINMANGALYDRDVATAIAGPVLGSVGQLGDAKLKLAVRNSDNTNTAERNFAKAFYDATLLPGISLLATFMPAPIGAAAIQAGSSGAAREGFASMVAGDKRATRAGPPRPPSPPRPSRPPRPPGRE